MENAGVIATTQMVLARRRSWCGDLSDPVMPELLPLACFWGLFLAPATPFLAAVPWSGNHYPLPSVPRSLSGLGWRLRPVSTDTAVRLRCAAAWRAR